MLRIGFVCIWDTVPQKTWSGTTWSIFQALRTIPDVEVTELPMSISPFQANLVRLRHVEARASWQKRNVVSSWRYSPLLRNLHESAFAKATAQFNGDAIFMVGQYGVASVPTFSYQDITAPALYEDAAENPNVLLQFDVKDRQAIRAFVEQQRQCYQRLDGVCSMSTWDARNAVQHGIVPEANICVVGGGRNVRPSLDTYVDAPNPPTIVFIGRDFYRKGGDLLLNASERIAATTPLRLVIAGPERWPLASPIPAWVTFLGDVPYETLQHHLRSATIAALPSRFEAFGIAVVEALASGVPVLGKKNSAMAEMITDGVNGVLVDSTTEDIERGLQQMLHSPWFAINARRLAPSIAEHYSWDAVARRVVDFIRQKIAAPR
jgi:glycosyltransferase involved in cell wall biosynthesis